MFIRTYSSCFSSPCCLSAPNCLSAPCLSAASCLLQLICLSAASCFFGGRVIICRQSTTTAVKELIVILTILHQQQEFMPRLISVVYPPHTHTQHTHSCSTDLLGVEIVKTLLTSACTLLSSRTREVVKSTLGLVKVSPPLPSSSSLAGKDVPPSLPLSLGHPRL